MALGGIADAARQYKVVESNVAATSPGTKLVGQNPTRVAIMFSSWSGQVGIRGSNFPGSVSTGMTFNVVANQPSQLLTFENFGPWVQGEFWGTPTAGSIQVGIIEVLYVPTS